MAPDEIDDPRPDVPDDVEPDAVESDDAGPDDVGLVEESEPTMLSSADLLARATGEPEDRGAREGEADGDGAPDEEADDPWEDPSSGLEAMPVFRGDRRRIPRPRRPAGPRVAAPRPSGSPAPASGYRVRRVRRLVRHIEPWSVLKVSLVFYLCVWGLLVIATRMLWSAADEAGTIGKVESFIEELFALETFEFDTAQIFRIFVLGGLVLVVGGIGVTVVLVVLFNLISDLTGGVRFTMVEEETAVRQRRLRRGDVVVSPDAGRPTGPSTSSEASPGADTVSEAPGL